MIPQMKSRGGGRSTLRMLVDYVAGSKKGAWFFLSNIDRLSKEMRLLSKQQIQKDLTPCAPFPDVCNDATESKTDIIGIITDSIYSLFSGDVLRTRIRP